ncbi:RNA polymerase sigma factor [Nakamurella deserti]|uniref:RNA polymerase sigma factor n=1 Tax=Nakamurella deserti TaxID=2164074 RepID=UPI000DBE74FD|nr:sigma-70 family RNA polymerase sigma factor [Nakamurella deserti]
MHTDDRTAEAGETDVGLLVTAARHGDPAAWNALVDRYNRLVWSVARSFRLSDADAADAVQLTWMRLVENLDRITEPDRIASWLGTTVRRECLQHLRRSGRLRLDGGDEFLESVPDPAPPVDAALLEDERDRALWEAMRMLGDRCRRLLRVLMASPPPPYSAVAAALDMPMGSIGPARQRCLAQLRTIITAEPDVGRRPPPRGAR